MIKILMIDWKYIELGEKRHLMKELNKSKRNYSKEKDNNNQLTWSKQLWKIVRKKRKKDKLHILNKIL